MKSSWVISPSQGLKKNQPKVAFSLNNFLPKVIKKKKKSGLLFQATSLEQTEVSIGLEGLVFHTLSQVVRYGIKSILC